MNCSVNTPVQLSFFSESLNTIVCSVGDWRRSAAAEAMGQAIRDRGWTAGRRKQCSSENIGNIAVKTLQ
jgi:hypothetical protein